jgi:hypothetical protein
MHCIGASISTVVSYSIQRQPYQTPFNFEFVMSFHFAMLAEYEIYLDLATAY